MATNTDELTETEVVDDLENCPDSDSEDVGPTVRLSKGISVKDSMSEDGCVFELANEFDDLSHTAQPNLYKLDENLLSNLHGADYLEDDTEEDEDSSGYTNFEKLARKMEDLTPDGKVKKKIIKQGIENVVPEDAFCTIHYEGFLEESDEPYDSSRLRGKPLSFRLGSHMILGLNIGVQSMKKSEIACFLIHHDYAFLELGCPPRIPQKATILFEVELLSFVDSTSQYAYNMLPEKELNEIPFKERRDVVRHKLKTGNSLIEVGNFNNALKEYRDAIRMLDKFHMSSDEEEQDHQSLLLKCLNNSAFCEEKKKEPNRVISLCNRVRQIEPDNVKANFRMGRAYMEKGEFLLARQALIRAQKVEPRNREINQEIQTLNKKETASKQQTTEMCKLMFGGGNVKKSLKDEGEGTEAVVKDNSSKNSTAAEFRTMIQDQLDSMKKNPEAFEFQVPVDYSESELEVVADLATKTGLYMKTTTNLKGQKKMMICKEPVKE